MNESCTLINSKIKYYDEEICCRNIKDISLKNKPSNK